MKRVIARSALLLRRGGVLFFAVSLALPLLAASEAHAQLDLTGTWQVSAISPAGGCTWVGSLYLRQTIMSLAGEGSLALQAGGPLCPDMPIGMISSGVVTSTPGVDTTWTDGVSEGSFLADYQAASGMLAGTFSVSQGPFVGLSGTWTGTPAAVDLTGGWNLTAEETTGACGWGGTASLAQTGSALSGSASLALLVGNATCPQMPAATISTGSLTGSQMTTVWSDGVSEGDFDGSTPDGNSLSGSYSISQGPFTGMLGSWNALREVLDLSGDWQLAAEYPAQGCSWAGAATLAQSGEILTGDASLSLVSGPALCPPSPAAMIATGMMQGTDFSTTFSDGSSIGVFNGTSTDGNQLSGIYSIGQGPFLGFVGTWTATRLAAGVPALGAWALLGLALLLLATLGFIVRRGRTAS